MTIEENAYYIVRTEKAGVFFAKIVKLENNTADLKGSRRLWYWEGAATLSQLSVDGVLKPLSCKFPMEVEAMMVFGVIEIIKCTEKAIKSINEVPIWKV